LEERAVIADEKAKALEQRAKIADDRLKDSEEKAQMARDISIALEDRAKRAEQMVDGNADKAKGLEDKVKGLEEKQKKFESENKKINQILQQRTIQRDSYSRDMESINLSLNQIAYRYPKLSELFAKVKGRDANYVEEKQLEHSLIANKMAALDEWVLSTRATMISIENFVEGSTVCLRKTGHGTYEIISNPKGRIRYVLDPDCQEVFDNAEIAIGTVSFFGGEEKQADSHAKHKFNLKEGTWYREVFVSALI